MAGDGDGRRARRPGKRVVVVGAGIAGLTAAHELVERGFEVQVVEADYVPVFNEPKAVAVARFEPRLGGMARTQWAVAQVPPERIGPGSWAVASDRLTMQRLAPFSLPPPIRIEAENEDAFVEEVEADSRLKAFERWRKLGGIMPLHLRFRGIDVDRAEQLVGAIDALNRLAPQRLEVDEEPLPFGSVRVEVSVEHDRYPAEHGFRFFPSFYLHLFDTMKRTPLGRSQHGRREGSVWAQDDARNAFDLLVPAESFRFGIDAEKHGGKSFTIARRPPRSLSEVGENARHLLESAGYEAGSVARVVSKLLQYLTSCEKRRREELEEISWIEFLTGGGTDAAPEGFDSRLWEHLTQAPQALAAMSASKNDARTIAYVGLQLILDQFRDEGYSDGTLSGPTSLWLDAWGDYLRSQGVRFTAGRLVGFEEVSFDQVPVMVRPVVLAREWNDADEAALDPRAQAADHTSYDDCKAWSRVDVADYTVITVPVDRMWEVLGGEPPNVHERLLHRGGRLLSGRELVARNALKMNALEAAPPAGTSKEETLGELTVNRGPENDFERFKNFAEECRASHGWRHTLQPDEGPLRWMVGIQFYSETDAALIKGHTMCSDSAWGVSYLSQTQYWTQRPRAHDGYRGVLSAILTRFGKDALAWVPPLGTSPTSVSNIDGWERMAAKDCAPAQIAYGCWRQIWESLDEAERRELSLPAYFYIDENLSFEQKDGPVDRNGTPYLVNHMQDWKKRPGRRTQGGKYRYDIQVGNCVFAGVLMRTHTRLTTMESANESARRAVNAILDAEGSRAQRCRLWRLEEERGVRDFSLLQQLDERLYNKGRRHAMDNPLTEGLLRALPFDLARFALPLTGRRSK